MDKNGCQVSVLVHIDCHWVDPDLKICANFDPALTFSATTLNDFQICSLNENPFLLDELQVIYPPPKTPVTQKRTRLPALLEFQTLYTEQKKFLFLTINFFRKVTQWTSIDKTINEEFRLMVTSPKVVIKMWDRCIYSFSFLIPNSSS